MNVSINFECRDYISKRDGKIPLTARIWTPADGNQYLKLGKRIKAKYYDFQKNEIKSGLKGSSGLQLYVRSKLDKVDNILNQLEKEGLPATFFNISRKDMRRKF